MLLHDKEVSVYFGLLLPCLTILYHQIFSLANHATIYFRSCGFRNIYSNSHAVFGGFNGIFCKMIADIERWREAVKLAQGADTIYIVFCLKGVLTFADKGVIIDLKIKRLFN